SEQTKTAATTSDIATVTNESAVESSTSVSQAVPSGASTPLNLATNTLPEASQTPVEQLSVSQPMGSENSSVVNPADTTLAQSTPAAEATTPGSTREVLEQINQHTNPGGESLDQITNVTQLSDVSPGDWAYEALRSLVERYGCIAGYPDGTFRGNRATTRYEFAAGLNACLQQVERLIAASVEGFVTREDLETLQRLVQEFEVELATLGTRVDDLEGRAAFLEDHQFSTTTKLNGEVIFAISDLFGGEDNVLNADFDDNTVFQDRVRLNFDTSFTGRDRLRTRLQAGNVAAFPALGRDTPGRNRLTREGRLGFETIDATDNDVILDFLGYRFPVGPAVVQIFIADTGGLENLATTVNPLDSSGSGSISRFGQHNPIYYIGAGGAGAGITFAPSGPFRVDLGYLSGEAEAPADDGGGGSGIFNGDYSAIAQVTFQPADFFRIAATYIHSYDESNLGHGTGSFAAQINPDGDIGVVGNSYGVEASIAFSPQLVLSGWAGYTDAIILGTGGADVWNYGATLAINDLGTEGSTLGFVVGMEPKLTGSSVAVGNLLPGDRRRDPDTGLHIEGFYKLKVSDNIAITPGVIWLTAPGHNEDNDDIFVGTIRTTFTF
ncbi:MAG: iron uptake porin, partial [Microcoleus sp. SIO2G3]|nr:iron uptake porin [Microcoleus sp. SIO2G3]